MLSATCHCGAVRIELPRRPAKLTNCNCSMAVNARSFDPATLGPVVIRHFDGADTWTFLD